MVSVLLRWVIFLWNRTPLRSLPGSSDRTGLRRSITGVTPKGQTFNGASDTIGFKPLPPGVRTAEEFFKRQDGADVLFLELTDPLASDEGTTPLSFRAPLELGCPENSHPL